MRKLAFNAEVIDVRDVERTPTWMHAHNALIDKLRDEAPENPLYHPGFSQLDMATLYSMIPENQRATLKEFYPDVETRVAPPALPTQAVQEAAGLKPAKTASIRAAFGGEDLITRLVNSTRRAGKEEGHLGAHIRRGGAPESVVDSWRALLQNQVGTNNARLEEIIQQLAAQQRAQLGLAAAGGGTLGLAGGAGAMAVSA